MKPIVKGMFARSLAGHDKGKLYVISDVQEPYVFLVDGKIRTAARPKKKKLIHVQPDYEMTDAVRDEDIRKALKEKTTDMTVLMVSQRASTVKDADKIIVLDNGEIVGIGTHDYLLNNCEVYKEICLSQLTEKEASA